MAELEKTILTVPELPAVVKGDGRYVMSLIRQFLRDTAEQVNLANGFTAEEIYPSTDVQTPKNFFLSFDRFGARFTWDHILKIDTLLYYELRTDTNAGSDIGLLERTIETESTVVPAEYSADVYLYAVTKDGGYSSPAKISYTKARPEEPEDLALTKNNEGTLITFLEIPTNCIGANVYVNGQKYVVYDNIFLYQGSDIVRIVEVAYFDSFGEGQRATLVSYIPDVTGFMVERNGDSLDFYWDELNAHGVQYVVKVGQTPVWETSIEVFRTKLNKKKYIFPRTGTFYFLIKALSEQGVYSENAAWVSTVSTIDINRNVILSFDQDSILYSGSKVNMYYDAVGQSLVLDRNVFYGEYLINVTLQEKYLARSWVDYQAMSVATDSEEWDEALFAWNSDEGDRVRWAGASAGIEAKIKTDIALKLDEEDIPAEILDNFSLNDTLVSDRGQNPSESQNADEYVSGRWGNGVYIANDTRISYQSVDFPAVFSTTLNVKVTEAMSECVFLTLQSADGWLMVGHSGGDIYLRGSDGGYIGISVGSLEREWMTLGFAQSETKRTLFVKLLAQDRTESKSQENAPVGRIKGVYMYPNIEIRQDVLLKIYDVEDESLITTVNVSYLVADKYLYLNNSNAPTINGYDFVVMDGIKHTDVVGGDSFKAWYVRNTVADRTKTNWASNYENSTEIELPALNTYGATSLYHTFKNASMLRTIPKMNTSNVDNFIGCFEMCYGLTTIPEIDTSKATAMSYMFHDSRSLENIPTLDTSNVTSFSAMFMGCTALIDIPPMNTSKAQQMNNMFRLCSSLDTIKWDIDMSSCTNCTDMFTGCSATNIRLKNVPPTLDLSNLGTTKYTVVNYLE